MVSRYEALMLMVPEITEDEGKAIEAQMEKVVKGAKGSIISFDRWGKYKLSYPVRKHEYGNYFLARFETETGSLEEIRSLLAVRFHELVMRHMVIQLDPKTSLVYQKPQSLEDAPSRDVNTFLKDNKMEGLMASEGGSAGDVDFDEDED